MAISAHTNNLASGTSAAQLYGPDNGRLFVSIKNTHASNAVCISGDSAFTPFAAGNGHTLGPGDHIEISGQASQTGMYIVDSTSGSHATVSYLEVTQT